MESMEEIVDRLEAEVQFLRDEIIYLLSVLAKSPNISAINLGAGAALEDHTERAT